MKKLIAIALALLLAGCISIIVVVVNDPETVEEAEDETTQNDNERHTMTLPESR